MEKKPYLFRSALLFALLVFNSCEKEDGLSSVNPTSSPKDEQSISMDAKAGPSVNGHGNLTVYGGLQTFSFHASYIGDQVKGTFEGFSRGQDTRLHGDITCLQVIGNVAVLSGIVTKSTNEAFPVGRSFYVKVQDNGEGKNSVDLMTDPNVGTFSVNCNPGLFGSYLPIEAGNIQVKP